MVGIWSQKIGEVNSEYISFCGMHESLFSVASLFIWIYRALVLFPVDSEPDVPALTEVKLTAVA